MIRKSVALMSLAVLIGADGALAQGRATEGQCKAYANGAVAANKANVDTGCGMGGPEWNASHDAHFNWCMSGKPTSELATENRKRSTALASCRKDKQAKGAGKPAGSAEVTNVALRVVPPQYSGKCPHKVRLIGTITANGPGQAYYDFEAGAVGANMKGSVNFSGAGTKTVSSEGEVKSTPRVHEVRLLAGMEPRKPGQQKLANAELHIACN